MRCGSVRPVRTAYGRHRLVAAQCSAVTISSTCSDAPASRANRSWTSNCNSARRRYDGGRYYFIVNGGDRDVHGWLPLGDRAPGGEHLRSHDRAAWRCGESIVERRGAGGAAFHPRPRFADRGDDVEACGRAVPHVRARGSFDRGPGSVAGPFRLWRSRSPARSGNRPASVVDDVRRRRGEAIFGHGHLPDDVRETRWQPTLPGCWISVACARARASCSTAATWAR